ncbi:MAG: NADH-quinone oxidoreductase subunit A [Bdellovibrionales bacterium]|nr:NADH-quinone oxidoreductase subunit A [Bdellovibrionales bacterium]
MTALLPILFLLVFVVVFGYAIVFLTGLAGPKPVQTEAKKEVYECGVTAQSSGNTKIPVKFYLTAILFILFDIEIIFMYPWAVSFGDFIESGYGLQALVAMGIFLLVFIFGLFWEVKSKALDWD